EKEILKQYERELLLAKTAHGRAQRELRQQEEKVMKSKQNLQLSREQEVKCNLIRQQTQREVEEAEMAVQTAQLLLQAANSALTLIIRAMVVNPFIGVALLIAKEIAVQLCQSALDRSKAALRQKHELLQKRITDHEQTKAKVKTSEEQLKAEETNLQTKKTELTQRKEELDSADKRVKDQKKTVTNADQLFRNSQKKLKE
ncbi:unnamed protein product, partial [Rotaria sp. Silwood1]